MFLSSIIKKTTSKNLSIMTISNSFSIKNIISFFLFSALSVLMMQNAHAQQTFHKAVPEKSITSATGWYYYYNISADKIKNIISSKNARIIDIEVVSTSPYRFNVAMVVNSGVHKKAWWWFYGVSESRLNQEARRRNARIIDIERYTVGSKERFAAVLVPNKGQAWWWYYGMTSDGLKSRIKQHNAAIIDIETYTVNGKRRYAAVFAKNTGGSWYYYLNVTSSFIAQKMKDKRVRIFDIERFGSNKFAVVLVRENDLDANRPISVGGGAVRDFDSDTKTRTWLYMNCTASQLKTLLGNLRRYKFRISDIESRKVGSQLLFDVLLLRNGGK